MVVQIEAVVTNHMLEIVENESERDIGVSNARNEQTIRLTRASRIGMLQSGNIAADIYRPEITVTMYETFESANIQLLN